MVSAKFLSIALFGLQALAGPLPGFDRIIRDEGDFDHVAEGKLTHMQRRAVNQAMDEAINLIPIREDDLLPRHLRKRDDDLSRLDLHEQVKLMYGGVASREQMYLANMTLYAPVPSHPLILMEKFDGLTDSVTCGGDNNQITLKFKTKQAMDYAIQAWDWVNEKDTDCFYLITNHENCNENDQRHPYRIVDVQYDQKTFTTTLTSQTISWDDIASRFDINLGRANIAPAAVKTRRDITKRGFWDIFPKIDFKKSVKWELSTFTEGRKRLFTDPFHEFHMLTIDCVDCYIKGGIEFTGHIAVKGFKVTELYIGAQPKDLRARLELEVVILAGIPKPGINMKKTLFEVGIPGLSIQNIFTLGPSFQYQVGFEVAAYGVANFSVGVEVKVPDVAAVVGDLLDGGNSGSDGFDGVTVDPILRLNGISATAYSAVYAQPVLAFGIKILDRWGYEAALTLKLPWVAADLTVGYDRNGLCPEKDASIRTGIKTKGGINVELWFNAGMLNGPKFLPNYNKKLWGVRYPFWEMCFPFEIPGVSENTLPPPPSVTLPLTGTITEFSPGATPTEDNIMPSISITRTYLPPNTPGMVTAAPRPINPNGNIADEADVAEVEPTAAPALPIADKVENEKPKGGPHNAEAAPEAVAVETPPVVTRTINTSAKPSKTPCTKTSTLSRVAATPVRRRAYRKF